MVATRIPDPHELISTRWPVDGPHSADALAEAMTALGELVRYANHATHSRAVRAASAPDAHAVVNRLAAATGGLAQLCNQLSSWVDALATEENLRHDHLHGIDAPRIAALRACADLDGAAALGAQLGYALGRASTELAPLYHADSAGGAR